MQTVLEANIENQVDRRTGEDSESSLVMEKLEGHKKKVRQKTTHEHLCKERPQNSPIQPCYLRDQETEIQREVG